MPEHAIFGGTWGDPGDPGFGISGGEVESIQKALPGCAVTLNHSGLKTALANLQKVGSQITADSLRKELSAAPGAASRPIGTVLQGGAGTNVVFTLNPNFSGLGDLLRAGLYNGISLSHVTTGGRKEPIELALTTDPARGNANVIREYKPFDLEVVEKAMSAEAAAPAVETPAVAEKTPLEAIMEGLSPEQQQVIIGRLQEYEEKHTELSDAAAAAAKATEDAKKEAEIATAALAEQQADKQIVKDQIEHLRTLLTQNGCAAESERLSNVGGYLDQGTLGHSQLALEQVVTACNRAFASVSAPAARPAKRRVVESAPAAVPAAPAAVARVESSSDIRNLLRSQFDAPLNDL